MTTRKKRMAVATPPRTDVAKLTRQANRRAKELFAGMGETQQILAIHAPKIIYDYPNVHRPGHKVRPWQDVAKLYLIENFGPKFAARVMTDMNLRDMINPN